MSIESVKNYYANSKQVASPASYKKPEQPPVVIVQQSKDGFMERNKEFFLAGATALGLATFAILNKKNKLQKEVDSIYKNFVTEIKNHRVSVGDLELLAAGHTVKGRIPKNRNIIVINLDGLSKNNPLKSKYPDSKIALGHIAKDSEHFSEKDFEILELLKVDDIADDLKASFKKNNFLIINRIEPNEFEEIAKNGIGHGIIRQTDELSEIDKLKIKAQEKAQAKQQQFYKEHLGLQKYSGIQEKINSAYSQLGYNLSIADVMMNLAIDKYQKNIDLTKKNFFILDANKLNGTMKAQGERHKIAVGIVDKSGNPESMELLSVYEPRVLDKKISSSLKENNGFSTFDKNLVDKFIN